MKPKHIFLSSILLAASIGNVNAQGLWYGSPINTFTKDNVGIGLTAYSPYAKLSIYNDLTAGAAIPEIGVLRFTGGTTTGPNFFELVQEISSGGTATTLDVFNSKGHLGILTDNPLEALDVNGNARIRKNLFTEINLAIGVVTAPVSPYQSRFYIYNDINTTHIPEMVVNRIEGNNAPDFFELTQQPEGGGAEQMMDVFNSQGWLGILTGTPHAALDVYGNAIIEKNLQVNLNANIAENLTVGINATVDGNLQVNGNATINQNETVGQNLTVVANATIDGNLQVNGNATINQNETVGQNLTVDNNLQVNGSATINENETVGKNLYVTDSETIGDNLYISGGAMVGSTSLAKLYIYNDLYNNYLTATVPIPEIKLQRNVGEELTTGEIIPNFLEVWNKQLYHLPFDVENRLLDVIDRRGYLGLGTGTPSEFLDVDGNALIEDSLIVDGPMVARGGVTMNDLNVQDTLMVGDIAVIGYNAYPFTLPTGYSLYVSKGILTSQVRVAIPGTPEWSDYVFNKDYKLMPLKKVEEFIKTNSHLPEVPSASDVTKDGIDVASMDANLLKKIEELTLYAIEQQKQIDKLQAQLASIIKDKKDK